MDNQNDLAIYELRDSDLDEALKLRNSIFTPVDHEHWKHMRCTAVLARDKDGLLGCIPLQFRDLTLRDGISIPVVFENAVGVSEKTRGRGIGSRMLDVAAGFIEDRVDVLMVVRGGERAAGYRFYRRTGHGDVLHCVDYSLADGKTLAAAAGSRAAGAAGRATAKAAGGNSGNGDGVGAAGGNGEVGGAAVSRVDREKWVAAEGWMLRLYNEQYGAFGGGRPRRPGYWPMILDSHVFKNNGWEYFLAHHNGEPAGYLLGGYGTWQDFNDLHVHEVVGTDEAVVTDLLAAAGQASRSGVLKVPNVSMANPVRETLTRLGFSAGESTPQLMARILRPERVYARLAADSSFGREIAVTAVTPHRTIALNAPLNPRYSVRMELKEAYLSRLLLCRINLSTALDMELIRWVERDPLIEAELNRIFRFNPWIQWFSDYV